MDDHRETALPRVKKPRFNTNKALEKIEVDPNFNFETRFSLHGDDLLKDQEYGHNIIEALVIENDPEALSGIVKTALGQNQISDACLEKVLNLIVQFQRIRCFEAVMEFPHVVEFINKDHSIADRLMRKSIACNRDIKKRDPSNPDSKEDRDYIIMTLLEQPVIMEKMLEVSPRTPTLLHLAAQYGQFETFRKLHAIPGYPIYHRDDNGEKGNTAYEIVMIYSSNGEQIQEWLLITEGLKIKEHVNDSLWDYDARYIESYLKEVEKWRKKLEEDGIEETEFERLSFLNIKIKN